MEFTSLLFYFLPLLLYAEIHYSFKWIYSRFKKNEPEIIADVPFRIEPEKKLPILIYCKDAHRFPISIESVLVTIFKDEKIIYRELFELNKDIAQKSWWQIVEIESSNLKLGEIEVEVEIEIIRNKKKFSYINDNYRISSHAPFRVYIPKLPLPGQGSVIWGDLHYHSSYTEDQVEFGAPLEATIKIAHAFGLKFFAVTDHSYDLDDLPENYLINDPDLQKWNMLQKEVAELNKKYSEFKIIPGEEVSSGNSKGKNVHFLVLNNKKFFAGKGDGAEKWLRNKPDLTTTKILADLEKNALAFSAHPEVEPPLLQKLLIRRGKWEESDYQNERLDGMQVWNGRDDIYFKKGISRWKKLILEGKRLTIVAGNDAHGNFNRFRQIGFPFWTFREKFIEVFGYARTGIIRKNVTSLVEALRMGACIISNGPFLNFTVTSEGGDEWKIGEEIEDIENVNLNIFAQSTEEFGELKNLRIFIGDLFLKKEKMELEIEDFSVGFNFRIQKKLTTQVKNGYIRGELFTNTNSRIFSCFTNPIWINSK